MPASAVPDRASRALLSPAQWVTAILVLAAMPPPDLKLATGLFVLTMLALPSLKGKGSGLMPRETMKEN